MKSATLSFRFLGKHYTIRVSDKLRKSLGKISYELDANITELIMFAVVNLLNNYADKTDKETNEFIREFNRKKNLKYLRKAHKEKRFCRYLIKNTQRTLFEQQRSFFFNSGNLNMKIANKTIDEAKKEFKCFPVEIRKELEEEMGFLERFREPDFLMGRIGIFKQVEMMKRKK